MAKPPKIVVPGLNRGAGIPPGFVMGRLPGTGKGPAQLLALADLRQIGLAGQAGVAQNVSTVNSSITSLSSAVSSAISGNTSSTSSLSTAVSVVDRSQSTSLSQISSSLSTTNSTNITQSTSLSLISSSLSGAISSTTSLSSAISTVISGSISVVTSGITSLSTAIASPKVPVSTVALLPSAGAAGAGAIRAVSDALAPSLGVVVVGGGGIYCLVLSDGANWVAC